MPGDSGFYMCVTDDFSTFYPAAVDVLPFPIYQEKLRYAAPGEQYRLVCDVPDIRSRIYWFKDGVPYASPRPNVMVDNDQGLIRDITFSAEGRSITLRRIRETDAGVYTCISQRTGDKYHKRSSLANQSIQSPTIHVAVSRYRSSVLWIKDGRPLDDRQGRLSFSNGNRQVIFRNIRGKTVETMLAFHRTEEYFISRLWMWSTGCLQLYHGTGTSRPPEQPKPQSSFQPGILQTKNGDMFELYCNLSASALRQPITWTKDDNYLLLSDTTDEKPTLLLPDAMDERPMLELPGCQGRCENPDKATWSWLYLVCDLPPTVEYNAPIRWYKNGAAYDIPNTGRVSLLKMAAFCSSQH
uniref:Ig-like domain-containing protein n=1 Tax=Magallana gigas TaxID=29159 RepID=A0A8W8MGE4_MAGGI